MSLSETAAQTIAIQALGWLAGHEELSGIFMGATGLSQDDLRASAQDPEFLGFVLDFLTQDDAWVIGFCDDHSLEYEIPLKARHALPGGQQMHWT